MSIRMRYAFKAIAYFFALLTVFGFVYADSDSSFTDIKRLDRIAVIIDERYAEEIDLEELVEEGIDGMLNSLDPYCRYFTDEDFQEFMDNTYGQFEGIGIEVDLRKNNLTIISVLEGTPAYRAGFRPGDKIVAIEGKLTSEMTREEAAKMMRGSAGTSLTLSIHRIGRSDLMKYTLMRESVETKSIPYYSMLNDGLGYIRLTRFTETSYYEMTEALTSLVNSKAKGIILDLRSNPGGLLLEAVRIAGLILEPDKLVVETQSRNGSYTRHFSFNEGISATNIPLAVLVDEGTASAAEILSGAIQDWDRGVIIGSPTYGKGLVQRIIRLDTESALKLTTAKYYIPSGRCIQKIENAGRLDVSSI
ncbi:MAG: S41 family peptidase, partial [candidate division Zixibacteria bacterium]|nr:S41 family peptidase [candidate division Zixibacteria bacterium]